MKRKYNKTEGNQFYQSTLRLLYRFTDKSVISKWGIVNMYYDQPGVRINKKLVYMPSVVFDIYSESFKGFVYLSYHRNTDLFHIYTLDGNGNLVERYSCIMNYEMGDVLNMVITGNRVDIIERHLAQRRKLIGPDENYDLKFLVGRSLNL